MTKANQFRYTFDWSLKPFTSLMKLLLGLNVDAVQQSLSVRLTIPAIGFFVIICHLVINGPCGVYSSTVSSADWKVYDSAFTFVSANPKAMAALVGDICRIAFFLVTPVIHIVLMAHVLLTNHWKDLWLTLKKIQNKMNLDKDFYRKCRCHCFIALVLLLLVHNS